MGLWTWMSRRRWQSILRHAAPELATLVEGDLWKSAASSVLHMPANEAEGYLWALSQPSLRAASVPIARQYQLPADIREQLLLRSRQLVVERLAARLRIARSWNAPLRRAA